MNKFLIARHGETENNRAGRLSGWIDTPLTSSGLVPTEKVAEKLQNIPMDKIYSSDIGRAFITAYTLARRLHYEGEIIGLAGLREVNYGDAANLKSEEAYKLYPGLDSDTHFAPPNGESLHSMQARVVQTINELNSTRSDATLLLVAHSGVMAAIHASHTGQDFGEHNISEAYPHDYVAQFTVSDGRIASFEEIV